MKKLFLLALASLTLIASPALAETAVGVVNFGKITQVSKAATAVQNQVKAKQKAMQSEADAKEKALLAEDQALVKQKDSADKAAFEAKVKAFREKAAKEQRAWQDKKVALNKSTAEALDTIQKSLIDIVKQVAAEKKLNLVISSAQVLHSDASLDITDEVLKRLDAKLPTVAVKF